MRRCSEHVNCVKLKQLVAMQEKVVSLLQTIVEDPLMRHSAVLVFANKQDLVRAQPAAVNLVSASRLRNTPVDTFTQAFSWICRKGL